VKYQREGGGSCEIVKVVELSSGFWPVDIEVGAGMTFKGTACPLL
jgi:hypothetical protein